MSASRQTKAPPSTTIRVPNSLLDRLDTIRASTTLTRNALVGLAVDAFTDFVERTGKMPVPRLRRKGGPQ